MSFLSKLSLTPERFYSSLPRFARSIALELVGVRTARTRYSESFQQHLREAQQRLEMSNEDKFDYTLKQLRHTLSFHNRRSAYYRKLFLDLNIDPERIEIDQFKMLPIQTKDFVKHAMQELLATSPGETVVHAHTSGTTGSGLRFPVTRSADHVRWATWWRYRIMHGINFGTWCSYFGGRTIVPPSYSGQQLWHVSHALRQVMYSMYHMGPDSIHSYLDDLNRRKLPWIHGYPSTIAYLAHLIEESGSGLDYQPEWISLGAENVRPDQISSIQRVFGVKPIQHYGLAEPVANISEHPEGSFFVDEDYAFVEFVPVAGQPSTYRVIGTSLHNNALLFLRYDTGDLVSIPSSSGTAFSGKPRQVTSFDGRDEDYLFLPDGRRVGRLDHLLKDIEEVLESQIHQGKDGRVTLRVVPGSGFDGSTNRKIHQEWSSRFGDAVDLSIEIVSSIPKGPNGKLRFVRSEIRLDAKT